MTIDIITNRYTYMCMIWFKWSIRFSINSSLNVYHDKYRHFSEPETDMYAPASPLTWTRNRPTFRWEKKQIFLYNLCRNQYRDHENRMQCKLSSPCQTQIISEGGTLSYWIPLSPITCEQPIITILFVNNGPQTIIDLTNCSYGSSHNKLQMLELSGASHICANKTTPSHMAAGCNGSCYERWTVCDGHCTHKSKNEV
jgi:hypothetical protein